MKEEFRRLVKPFSHDTGTGSWQTLWQRYRAIDSIER